MDELEVGGGDVEVIDALAFYRLQIRAESREYMSLGRRTVDSGLRLGRWVSEARAEFGVQPQDTSKGGKLIPLPPDYKAWLDETLSTEEVSARHAEKLRLIYEREAKHKVLEGPEPDIQALTLDGLQEKLRELEGVKKQKPKTEETALEKRERKLKEREQALEEQQEDLAATRDSLARKQAELTRTIEKVEQDFIAETAHIRAKYGDPEAPAFLDLEPDVWEQAFAEAKGARVKQVARNMKVIPGMVAWLGEYMTTEIAEAILDFSQEERFLENLEFVHKRLGEVIATVRELEDLRDTA